MKNKSPLLLLSSAVAAVLYPAAGYAAKPLPEDVERIEVLGHRHQLAVSSSSSATRTDTPLERIPQSVQVLSRDLLEQQDLQTISDALHNVSGVTPSTMTQTVLMSPLVRGFAAGYHFDGLPTYQLPASAADPLSLINVERIEVVKGPANALYGGGSGAPLAGLINIVSRDPGDTAAAEFSLRAGSYNTAGVQGRGSMPLSDTVAFSLAGVYEEADSYIDVVDSKRSALYPTLAWDISNNTRLILRGQYTRLEQQEYSGLPYEFIGLVDSYTFAGAEDAPKTKVENRMLTANLTHRFDDTLKADFSLRHHKGEFYEHSAWPLMGMGGTVYLFGSVYMPISSKETFATASLQKTLTLAGIQHQILFGTDYDSTDFYGGMGLDMTWGMIDYAQRFSNLPYGVRPDVTEDQADKLKTFALFLQDQISLTERLDLTASIRWSQLDIASRYTSMGMELADYDKNYSRLTPRIGLNYQLAEGVYAFAGYAEGFKGVVGALGVLEPEPETSQSYEIGLKLAEPVSGLTGSLALFDITRQNVITSDPNIPLLSVQTGEQRSKGIETDLIYQPANTDFSVLFSYAYTEAEVTKDNTLPTGDTLRAVPRHKGRLALGYEWQQMWLAPLHLGGGVTITSARELTLPNSHTVGGSALFDLQASWQLQQLTLGLSVINLTDKVSYEPYYYGGAALTLPTQPRSIAFSIGWQF